MDFYKNDINELLAQFKTDASAGLSDESAGSQLSRRRHHRRRTGGAHRQVSAADAH